MEKFTIQSQVLAFVQEHWDNERYALVNSYSISKINDGVKIKDDDNLNHLNGYVKIKSNTKTIYRICRSANGVKSGEVCLGYRTMSELKSQILDTVQIEPTTWFRYMWHNSELSLKLSFRITVIGLLASIISSIISILSLFFDLPLF